MKVWTKEQLQRFISVSSEDDLHHVFLLLATTGMRNRTIPIPHQVVDVLKDVKTQQNFKREFLMKITKPTSILFAARIRGRLYTMGTSLHDGIRLFKRLAYRASEFTTLVIRMLHYFYNKGSIPK